MRFREITGNNGYIEEHVKGGLDSYYQLSKAKSLAKADGHDYDKLPEYHRGADQPHKEKYKALAKEVNEVSDFKKRELEYELRHEEPKRDPKKRVPYRTPQERMQDANKRNSKKYKESLADKLSEAVAKCSDCGNTSYKTLPEEKQKGVDGKVCWKGYKRMGTKQKGGKTVDNCVKA